MNTKFHLISPDCIDFLPTEAIELLERATSSTPAPVFGPRDIILRAKSGIGLLILVERDTEVVGIFYIVFVTAQYGRSMNIVEFAANKLESWREDAKEFMISLLNEGNAQNILCISRRGISRLFPEFTAVGTLYEFRITH